MIATRARPARNALLNERLMVARRLSMLLADLDGMDRASEDQLVEVRAGVSSALARISEIDEQLAEREATPPLELNLAQPATPTPSQQRAAARGRLLVALTVLHDLPSSCSGAVRLLRKAIRRELRTIERSRREEFGHEAL